MDTLSVIAKLQELSKELKATLEGINNAIADYLCEGVGDFGDQANGIQSRLELCRSRKSLLGRLEQIETILAVLGSGKEIICSKCGNPVKDLERLALGYATHTVCSH